MLFEAQLMAIVGQTSHSQPLEKPEIPVFFERGKPNPTIWASGEGIYHAFMVIDGD